MARNIARITSEELKKMIEGGGDVVVIDTRDTASYNTEHIKGAVNVYYDPSGYSMERELMLSGLPTDRLLVPYCDCPEDTTSSEMAQELLNLRFDEDKVKVLQDGIGRWRELKYPVDKTE